MLRYPVHLTREGSRVLVSFPDFPNVHTYGEDKDEARARAVDALETFLMAVIEDREPIPEPRRRPLKREEFILLPALAEAKLGLPAGVLARTGAPVIYGGRKLNNSYDPEVERQLAELPSALDKIDASIGEGVLDGERLYVADFDIGTSLRLLMAMEDLRPAIESRPCGELAMRVQPKPPGNLGPVYPNLWLEPLHAQEG